MEDNQEMTLQTKVALTGVGMIVVWGTIEYVKIARIERKKRKKIQEWKDLNTSAINAFEQRLTSVAMDPTKTMADFVKAWNEEQQFMKLIQDQPIY